jgi:nitrogen fixation protein NifB
MVKAEFPHLMLCVATNGLNLYPYVDELSRVGLSHITVTVNAVDPAIGAKCFEWISVDGRRYAGIEAATLLWDRQRASMQALAAHGVAVKINTILVPGINDSHIGQVARTVSGLGASLLNIMPLLPTADTPFAQIPEPGRDSVRQARAAAALYLPQMTHCARCRSDAAGLVGEENSPADVGLLQLAAGNALVKLAEAY